MDKLRIIVSGLIGRAPVGGWHYLQYLVGLANLGHEVFYHEDTWCWPYHPIKRTYTDDPSYSVDYLRRFFAEFAPCVENRWHYRHLWKTSYGMDYEAFNAVAQSADVFLNVGGTNMIPDRLSPHCVKVFIDTDPGYNQIVLSEKFAWLENVERWCEIIDSHDVHFTYAENMFGADCSVPRLSFDWQTTRPPVVLDLWRSLVGMAPQNAAPWTTIMTWNPFPGPVKYEGKTFEAKAPEFEKLMDLPAQTCEPVEVAMGGGSDQLMARLARHGWRVVDGPLTTRTPMGYRDYLSRSKGELSCAKQIYVALRTGWFSERTTCYLASGRPAIVQDTGFGDFVPTGEGLHHFTDTDGARAAMDRVATDPARHARAAREIAEEFFAAERVLSHLVDRIAASRV
jgi:hypothetical protein